MIQQIYIKNFKAFEKETIHLDKHNIIIGENDAGKSSILQALDIFFNQEKIDKSYVRDTASDVEIGIFLNNNFYKKTYSPSTYKLSSSEGNINELGNYRYIYIPVSTYDPKTLINQLAIAKAIANTNSELLSQLQDISQSAINDVITGIPADFIVVNNESTRLIGEQNFKYDAALKFNTTTNGIPIEARGSGFQKNLLYALLVGNTYENVIIGIDEIENSFSISNSENMLHKLQEKLAQTIITTHSKKIMEVKGAAAVYHLYGTNHKSTAELLAALDNTDTQKYLIVEGKFDLPWYKKALNLLNIDNNFIILPGGGDNNSNYLKDALESLGKECIIIKDGDTNYPTSILKECIELYTPLDALNSLLGLTLNKVPQTKEEFFNNTADVLSKSRDYVKNMLAENCCNFLTADNEFVVELRQLLNL